jgi:pimeloyl-ACP methyl ester carboxylesterase
LTAILSPRFRVIAPDLPGFGFSTHVLPDYSFRAHGVYLVELLDALHVAKAQLVGFSMGGGVVLSTADLAPSRVASIVMLSAIGVQEHELLGSYEKNHALHGAQLAALWVLREGLPHFGLLDRFPLNVEYARNFYDSDQRPLRAILAHYTGPMLIIHESTDRNVPLAAALEHHRIVPQSELAVVNDNHFVVFERPQVIAEPLETFLDRVQNTGK